VLASRKHNRVSVLRVPPEARTSVRRALGRFPLHVPPPPWPELRPSFVELRRVVTRLAIGGATDLRVDYSRNGRRRAVVNAERDPELADAGLLQMQFLRTRPIAISNHGACRW